MADEPIARLSVDVVANLKIQKSQFAKAAKEAEKATEKKTGALKGMAEAISEADSSFGKLAKTIATSSAFSKLNEKIKGVTKNVGQFFAAIKRVAIYRAIRWALKELIQAFQEGRENAYQWALMVGNKFAKSMDMMSTSALYLKNSIGAMTMPLTNILAPIIDKIADGIVNVINLFNRLFAMLSGATSWTKALKYPASYLEQAAGAAKELKNQLLGFDELNILNAPDSGGGGSSMDYSSMFQDVALTQLTSIGKTLLTTGLIQAGIGAILLFTGHPLLGASLIANGLSTAIKGTSNGGNLTADVKKRLSKLSLLVGGFSLALGALILPTKPMLGIALLAAGAASLVSAVSVGWDSVTGELQTVFSWITTLVSGSLLALGVLTLPANPALGVSMIVAGAAGLITIASVNWSNIISWLKGGFEQIKALGKAFIDLALGKVITFAGGIVNTLTTAWNAIKNGLSNLVSYAISLAVSFVNNFTAPIQTAVRFIGNLLDELFGKHYNLDIQYYPNPTPPGGSYTNGNQGNAITGSGNSHQHGFVDPFAGMDGFANGGFPRRGTMFYAGESGAEFVGNIGGRTGVYNADQMTVALANANEGVVEALAEVGNAVIRAINNKDMSINVNDVRVAMRNSQLRYGV